MNKLALMLLLPLILSGCATFWYQEGKSFNECKRARAECFEELKKRTDFTSPAVDYEIKFMNECMHSKGYREVKSGELPMDAKRQGPESSLHWRTRGLAGSIE